jgi:membrane protein DedA with SNARE-associated domain
LIVAAVVLAIVVAVVVLLYVVYKPSISLHRLLRLFDDYGYIVIFVPVFIETAGLPVPGETTLLLAGVAASQGHIRLGWAILVGALAAILGDNMGYLIGRVGGRRLVDQLASVGRVSSSLGWGERFFERHGGKTVFFARWLPGLRIFGAWIAGMVRMHWLRFFLWNAAGGLCWATTVVLLGYFAGHSLGAIERVLGTGGVIALVGVIVVGLVLLKRHEKQRLHAHEND